MEPELTRNPSRDEVAAVLPGRWHVRATSSAAWLSGVRDSPTFEYELVSADPLLLNGRTTWIALNGAEDHWHGTHRWNDGTLEWRRSRGSFRAPVPWAVTVMSMDGNIVVARFPKVRASPGGVDILARDGIEIDHLQAAVTRAPNDFDVTDEELAQLTWMAPPDDR